MDEFDFTLSANQIDVAVVTETWFNDLTIQAADISHYSTFSKNRNNRRGGGVAIYVKNHLTVHPLASHKCDVECVWLKFKLKGTKRLPMNLYVGAIYFPPGSTNVHELLEHYQ